MLLSTTSSLEGQPIRPYQGLVHGETISRWSGRERWHCRN